MSYKNYVRKYAQKGGLLTNEDYEQVDALMKKYPVDRTTAELMVGMKYLADKNQGLSFLNSYGLDYYGYRKRLNEGLEKANLPDLADHVDSYLGTYNQPGNKSYGKLTEYYAGAVFPFSENEVDVTETEMREEEEKVPTGKYDKKKQVNAKFYPERDVLITERKRKKFLSELFGKKRKAVIISDIPTVPLQMQSSQFGRIHPEYRLMNYLKNADPEELKKYKHLSRIKIQYGYKPGWGGKPDYYLEIPDNMSEEEIKELKEEIAAKATELYTNEKETPIYEYRKVTKPYTITRKEKQYTPLFQEGGMLEGNPHEGGGVPIGDEVEAEGGEILLSVQASDALNQAAIAYQQANSKEKDIIALEIGRMLIQERLNQMAEEGEGEGEEGEMMEGAVADDTMGQAQMAMKGMRLKERLKKLNEF